MSRLHQDHFRAGRLNRRRDVPVPATHVEEWTWRRVPPYPVDNQSGSVLKPERTILDGKAFVALPFQIGNVAPSP